MLKLKQAELEEIKEVRKGVFGDADFDDEGLCLHVLARDGDEKAGAGSNPVVASHQNLGNLDFPRFFCCLRYV